MRTPLTNPSATAVGPYSHGIDADPLVFCSGQTPLDPTTGLLVEGSIGDRTAQCFSNLFGVLAAAGLGPGLHWRPNRPVLLQPFRRISGGWPGARPGGQGQRIPHQYGRFRRHERGVCHPVCRALPSTYHHWGGLPAFGFRH